MTEPKGILLVDVSMSGLEGGGNAERIKALPQVSHHGYTKNRQ